MENEIEKYMYDEKQRKCHYSGERTPDKLYTDKQVKSNKRFYFSHVTHDDGSWTCSFLASSSKIVIKLP